MKLTFKLYKKTEYRLSWKWIVFMLFLLTFIIRLSIFYSTSLFSFSDYGAYLSMIEKINSGNKVFLQNGNCFFTISYLGYFTKYILGSLNYFFLFNCFCGTIIGLAMYYVMKRVFYSKLAGIITIILYIFYTEFMVFSSVFYTPIIMIFLLSVFVMFLFFFYRFEKPAPIILSLAGLVLIFLLTFFFKPELLYFPIFLIAFSMFFVRKDKIFMFRSLTLALILVISYFTFYSLRVISHPDKNSISNSFIFFGHTNYGGDGGEGDFVYPENEARYDHALAEWCKKNRINQPDIKDINRFQREEIVKFVTKSPLAWIRLQFTKFFRTFGVVPESTSFMVLYSGLFKSNLWLTSIIVVTPVALIILLFVSFFNLPALRTLFISPDKRLNDLQDRKTARPQDQNNKHFISVYCLLFFYYLIATVFFGQYQERYRLPVMVVFIIPMLGYFIAKFNKRQFFNKLSLSVKGVIIVLFLVIWMFQAKKAISNKSRFDNAIESVKGVME